MTENINEQTEDQIVETQEEEQIVDGTLENEDVAESDDISFEDLGLDEYALKAVAKKGFVTPSPIQVLAIPRLLNGDSNLIARARTGTGKTAAFGLPIIQNIHDKSDHVEALILEPTRELAMQTCEEMKSFTGNKYPRTTVLYGGASYAAQIRELKAGCEIVVGTPGRIKDHLERKTLDLSKIKYFILDEGDEMLDMGFIDDIREIFQKSNIDARILLFSATMPAPILKIAADFMGEYDIIEEENVVDEALLIDQKYWFVKESEKTEALVRLIDSSPDFYGLVFTMTKMDADRVTRELDMRGYEAAALHGDIMQNQREKVLERFRLKKTRILVATDVAARGIDITGLSHVVNYSLPFDTATYVHRIGRTGRAGTTGIAVTFVRPEERRKLGYFIKNAERATKKKLTEEKVPSVNEVLTLKETRVMNELKEKLFEKALRPFESLRTAEPQGPQIDTHGPQNDVVVEPVETTATLRPAPEKFTGLAAEICKDQDPQAVVASLLSIMYGEKLSPKHYGKISTKDMGPRGDQLRIFVSLGKKDGYRARELADYFSNLLHIPGRMVDDIDVAQEFSLLSLPVASAKKAIELSRKNKKLPHMHIDVKEEGGGRKRNTRRHAEEIPQGEEKKSRGKSASRSGSRSKKSDSEKKSSKKTNRPNVHSQTERSSSRKSGNNASAFVKGKKKAERF
ncbi:MAG: DEAD/DEAH box helicase [Treponema sp.]|nr:DEAD/DEAH box helicase [Treponema sp.]